ncbi:MAG: tetratricopeptide repeat protein [Blastocatellia bacterium]|nr:tetratricopeptide repeat protein [Blastocatellia bacterium]
MSRNIRLLFELFWQPLTALKHLRDRAPVGFALGAAWLMTMAYYLIVSILGDYALSGGAGYRLATRAYGNMLGGLVQVWLGTFIQAGLAAALIVLFISVVYVPFAILIANLFERRASYSLVVREEFASTVSCALVSLAVSLLITILPAAFVGWDSSLLILIPLPIFTVLMTLSIGTVFRVGWVAAAFTSIISFMTLLGMPLLMRAATFVCASPFLFLLLLFLLRDRIDDFMRSARARQSFKQNLETATLNPADSSAHYNLGLLYQTRGDDDSAAEAFRKAVEIDNLETDAHYQLGRIARQQGKQDEAIAHFEKVVQQNPNHSHHEVWREIGLVYYAAGQYNDALEMLDKFLGERPSDAQGRYWRGLTLDKLGRSTEALQEMQECIETVKTAPAYKYRTERQWLHQAEGFLRERK